MGKRLQNWLDKTPNKQTTSLNRRRWTKFAKLIIGKKVRYSDLTYSTGLKQRVLKQYKKKVYPQVQLTTIPKHRNPDLTVLLDQVASQEQELKSLHEIINTVQQDTLDLLVAFINGVIQTQYYSTGNHSEDMILSLQRLKECQTLQDAKKYIQTFFISDQEIFDYMKQQGWAVPEQSEVMKKLEKL